MKFSLRVKGLAVVAAVAVGALVVGCGGDDGDDGGSSDSTEGKTVSILAPLANPFQTSMRNAAEAVAEENGMEVLYFSNDLDSEAEASAVQDSINRGVDAVIYGAIDSKASLAGFKQLQNADIPIVCFDTCVEEDQQEVYTEAFVTSDNNQLGTFSGKEAATYIEDELGGTAQVASVNCNIQSVCQERYDAQIKALDAVDYDLVDDQTALETDEVKAAAEGILQANQDLNVVITNGTPQTEGLTAAIDNLNREDDVKLFGIDITEPIAEALLDPNSAIQSTIGQDGDALGTKMMEVTVDVLEGNTPDQFLYEIPGIVYNKDDKPKIEEYLASIREQE